MVDTPHLGCGAERLVGSSPTEVTKYKSMDKVILLDLDGVMIPSKPWKANEILDDSFDMFKSQSVSKLNQLLKETGYDIVLSSARRYNHSIDEMNAFFK